MRSDRRDCGLVKLDPPSAGTATDGTTSLPGICTVIDGTPYCFVVNLGLHDTTIHPNAKLGTARVGGEEVQMSDPWTPYAPAGEKRRVARSGRAEEHCSARG